MFEYKLSHALLYVEEAVGSPFLVSARHCCCPVPVSCSIYTEEYNVKSPPTTLNAVLTPTSDSINLAGTSCALFGFSFTLSITSSEQDVIEKAAINERAMPFIVDLYCFIVIVFKI